MYLRFKLSRARLFGLLSWFPSPAGTLSRMCFINIMCKLQLSTYRHTDLHYKHNVETKISSAIHESGMPTYIISMISKLTLSTCLPMDLHYNNNVKAKIDFRIHGSGVPMYIICKMSKLRLSTSQNIDLHYNHDVASSACT